MANTKVTGLTELAEVPAATDLLNIVDISDTTMAGTGTNKKIQAKYFLSTNGTANTLGADLSLNNFNITNAGTITNTFSTINGALGTIALAGTAIRMNRASAANYLWANGASGFLAFGVNNNTLGTAQASLIISANDNISAKANFTSAGTITSNYSTINGASGTALLDGATIYLNRASGANYLWSTGAGGYWSIGVNGNTVGTAQSSLLITADDNIKARANFDSATLGNAWAGVSFGAGWVNFGSGWEVGSYKKFGDLVMLRGLVARTSGTVTTIATLPSGFRPPVNVMFSAATNSGYGAVSVTTAGIVKLEAGGTAWLSLNNVTFSTSA